MSNSHWINTMSRCALSSPRAHTLSRRALLAGSALMALPALVMAQAQTQATLPRDFPRDALRGELIITQPPQAQINGKAARLAPGARIRGHNNIMVLSGSLAGQKLLVHYTVDFHGLLKDIWILRPEEVARPWPATREDAATWAYDAGTRTWTRR